MLQELVMYDLMQGSPRVVALGTPENVRVEMLVRLKRDAVLGVSNRYDYETADVPKRRSFTLVERHVATGRKVTLMIGTEAECVREQVARTRRDERTLNPTYSYRVYSPEASVYTV